MVSAARRGGSEAHDGASAPLDRHGRGLSELRLSVTDRCNFRCRYCMPRERVGRSLELLDRSAVLTFEEIARVVGAFVALGVRKVRVTGGEPLLRPKLPRLVAMLAAHEGVELALTTNGVLLPDHAAALAEAGLRRINVSLDALDDAVFQRVCDTRYRVRDVLAGIDAAQRHFPGAVKVNAVVRRGQNEGEVLALAEHFRGTGVEVRFIELMDVGGCASWRREDVVTADEILEAIARRFPLEPVAPARPFAVAERYRYVDGAGTVGVIASVTRPFCGGCRRARLAADGALHTCLFSSSGIDLRAVLRAPAPPFALERAIAERWTERDDRYSELRALGRRLEGSAAAPVPMSYLGG